MTTINNTGLNFNPDSLHWELEDDDPTTGTRIYTAEVDGMIVQRTEYYAADDLINANKEIQKMTDNQRWGDGQIVASVPLPFLYSRFGDDIRDGDNTRIKRFLNDPDYKYLRTKRGNI
jgi:hypothetical protein